jgi:hypothetical protein
LVEIGSVWPILLYFKPESAQIWTVISIMMSFLTYITGFFKNFELFPSHFGYRTALMDTNLKGDHPRIISAKFGWVWLSSFRGEDFFLISSPHF